MAAPLMLGVGFGWVLHKARLGRYETVVNVFLFRDFTVLKFLLSALMVSTLGIQALSSLGLSVAMPVAETYLLGNLVGGAIFGVGMATAGFCPGTVAAGAGEGRLDYLVAGGLGLFLGALLYGVTYAKLAPLLGTPLHLGPVTFGSLLGVENWLLVAFLWEIGLLLFYALERGGIRPRS